MRRAGFWLVACCLLAVGVLGGALLGSHLVTGAPQDLTAGGGQSVSVTSDKFDDAHLVQLTASVTRSDPLLGNVSGTVTGSACRVGALVASGDVLGSVNGQVVRLFATSVPLWRDLRLGDRGSDVAAVQAELARLGVRLPQSGRVDSATATAVRAWLAKGGQSSTAATGGDKQLVLPLASLVWSSSTPVSVGACGLRPGTPFAAGSALLTPAPVLTGVALAAPITALPDQKRTLTVGSVHVDLGPGGTITDPKALEALAATPEVVAWVNSTQEDKHLEGTLALAEPVLAASVPPAAVIAVDSASPCLIDPAGPVTPVQVLSSQLGKTLVAPAKTGASLPARAVLDTTGSRTCS